MNWEESGRENTEVGDRGYETDRSSAITMIWRGAENPIGSRESFMRDIVERYEGRRAFEEERESD